MRTRRLYVLLTAVVAVIGLLFAAFHDPPEPSYGGKKLSQLVDRYVVDASESEAAIRQIGPSAVPYLLHWMRCQRPAAWKLRLYLRLDGTRWDCPWARRVLGVEQVRRAQNAGRALRALGPEAESAAGELTQMLNDWRHPITEDAAATAFAGLGSVGVPPLAMAMTNQQFAVEVRSTAAVSLWYTSDGQALLSSFLTNSDPVVRSLATNVLLSVR